MMRLFRLAVIAGLAALVLWGAWALLAPRLLGIRVETFVVRRGDIVQTIVATGRAETPSGVDVGSQIIGTVSRVQVREGDRAKAGMPLIVLDDRQATAGVEQARAALRQAEVRLRQLTDLTLPVARQTLTQMQANRLNARSQLDRALTLAGRSVASGASVESLQRAFEVADAQLRAAELAVRSASPGGGESELALAARDEAAAKLGVAEAQLRLTSILAPIDGLVTSRDVEEGTVVQPGKVLLHIAPDLPKQLVVQIDERNLQLVRLGQAAIASADANPAATFPATVASIDSTIDADRGSVEVKFDLPRQPDFLRENMTVSVDVEVARRDRTLLLPAEAIRNAAGNRPTVLAVVDGRAAERPVKIGARDATMVEVLEGVKDGDAVILAGTARIADGTRVRASGGKGV